jgi:chromate transport protein ChrA
MESSQILYILLGNLVTQIPLIILLIIGIIFSFLKWSKHPKVAKVCLGGLGVLVLAILINLGLSFLRIQLPLMLDGNYQLIGYINVGSSFIENLIWTFGLALLIVAVWVGRDKNHENLAK